MRSRPRALRCLLGRLGRAAVACLASAALLALRLTWRRVSMGSAPWPARAVLAFWHGDQLALSVLPRAWVRDTTVLVSRSADGQLGAVWARALGARVVRGSSSRGAVVGALGLRRCLRAAGRIALALDGPRGPRHAAGRSSTRLAAGAACPVVGVVAVPRRALHLRSWDRLAIPLPGTTIVVGWDVLPADDPAGALRRLWERAAATGRAGDGAQGRRRRRASALLGCLGWCLGLAATLGGCDAERARALEVLRSGDTSARVQALRVLAARPDPDLAPQIVPFLADPPGACGTPR
ncbi:MAG: DUF374 domain-containing protein [Proteobacteria bacterium]|nr:DUF374 domain-containing protein [Pseudomonadota bacterium]